MDEENTNKLLEIANNVLQDLDTEIRNLPKEQVWYCKSMKDIKSLIDHLDGCLNSYYQAMSGMHEVTRKMLLKMIKITQQEKEFAEAVYASLKAGD